MRAAVVAGDVEQTRSFCPYSGDTSKVNGSPYNGNRKLEKLSQMLGSKVVAMLPDWV